VTGRRVLAWGGLAALVVGALVWAAWPSSGPPTAGQRAHELATELRCPDCQALSVADSPSSSARAIRTDLEHRTAAGQSDAHIRQVYVNRYGASILLKPSSSGLGILVWGLPVVAVAVGAAGLALALARWRRQPRLTATDADEALVDGVRTA
jgi:cytochrome c-type biogenesis protein CcmH